MKKNLDNKILFNFILFISLFFITAFKKPEYKIIDKTIDDKKFYFAIPTSFCEYDMFSPEIFQFVKCYEIELEKEGELQFFTEKIFIAFEKNDKRIQNMTNKFFSKIQEENYKKLSKEEKNQYFFNENYPLNNTQNTSFANDNRIFNKNGFDEDGNKFGVYETTIFLNKKLFVIDWAQYLTKNEKLLSKKIFVDFVKKNQEVNELNNILYNYQKRQIIISKPKFDVFANYTDLKEINDGKFNGFFINLINGKKNDIKIFKISILPISIDTKDIFENLVKEDKKEFKNLELIKYKGIDFIKITRENTVMYINYIKFYDNIVGLLSMEFNKNNNDKNNKNLKFIYKYREQLIKDNKNN